MRYHPDPRAKDINWKLRTAAISFLFIAVLASGCKQEENTSRQLDRVSSETKAAKQDMEDYSFALKGEFTEKMRRQLAEINKELDQLDAKIEKSSDAVKTEAKPKLVALREQEVQLKKQLEDVQNATESSWDSVKIGAKKSYEGLKEGFQQSRQWLSDKIAP